MILIAILLTGLGFSADNTSKLDAKKCYDLVVETGRYAIVEGFYVDQELNTKTLDTLLDPTLSEIKNDSRLREEGRDGLAKIRKDLLQGYPCTEKGAAFFPTNSIRSYSYTCFPTENGVRRVDTKQYVIMQERLQAVTKVSAIPTGIFNTYVKMAASTIYEGSKLLPITEELSGEVERAARNRIKGTASLKLDAKSTKDLNEYCSEATVKATKTSIAPIQNGRRRPGAT